MSKLSLNFFSTYGEKIHGRVCQTLGGNGKLRDFRKYLKKRRRSVKILDSGHLRSGYQAKLSM